MRKTLMLFAAVILVSCGGTNTSDSIQSKQSEKLLAEATSQVGMPAIVNFRERKMLKDILELRDQDGLTTYTYLYCEMTGKLVFFGESIGYGIPYATQFTNPEKFERAYAGGEWHVLSQADPNGLFSPASAEGTWVLLKDPNGRDVRPVYIEPRIVVSPFRLTIN
ncbi:hypothetical protein A2108_01615 [Candidatus Wolfebacteria bacterium GWA1_42_9]|uniref:Uncharacterized protein n=1 Tax=Candidatus Wolfebacteria bacterium GWA1_42_9 TaxID=1802553 RepID=A0A1F8DLD8_9BACT|nr:MAG: hypothetical protein A2108_01615 [Candidatus Wolfebacteria bacterium GWA1_42_9]